MTSEYLRKEPCIKCSSSDGFAVYDDGHGYCFVCHHYEKKVEGTEGAPNDFTPAPTPTNTGRKQFVTGQYQDLPDRRIKEATLKKFGYTVTDGKHFAPYHDKDGRLVAQKVRTPEKDFYVVGDINKATLFGQHLWAPGQRLVVTEGEIDALSYAQVTGLTWQVCSVPQGAQSALKYISKNITFIEQFEEVVFLFDMDEPGQTAARQCAAVLQPGLAKIAKLPLKDANEMLQAGRDGELKSAVYSAIPYRPDGVISGADVDLDEVMKGIPKGLELPFPELNTKIRGLRKRELVLLCAGSGIGKSTLAREIGACLVSEHKQKVGWVMLEESLSHTVAGLVAIDHQVPLSDLRENPTLVPREGWESTFATNIVNCEFNTEWGCGDIDDLIAKLRYLVVGCGCDFIIFDHIHLAISGLKDHDERKAIDNLMTNLRHFVQQTGVGLIAVAHLKRNNNKESFNDGGTVSLTDLRGSAALEQLSDIVIAGERDQQSERDSNVTQLRLLKNRPHGVVGTAGKLTFLEDKGRLVNYDDTFDPLEPVGDVPF